MADYDDRPISAYDNLNASNMPMAATTMHTSTPKAKTKTAATNGAHSPYDEIAFKFNDNNKLQQQQQQQLLPNGQRNLNSIKLQQQLPSQVQQHQQPQQIQTHQPSTALYATPMKPTTAKTATTTATAATTPNIFTANANQPAQRPLSQHSQSELNEASQSIAAVKAALNDAKSKFFGLNGYAQDALPAINSLLQHPEHDHHHLPKPKVQIVPPQPKYQNIPENSAIYRIQQPQSPSTSGASLPPALPPKPSERQKSHSPDINDLRTPSPQSSTSPSPLSGHTSFDRSTPQSPSTVPSAVGSPTDMSSSSPSRSKTSGKHLPPTTAAFKQLPLNDIDGPLPSQAVYMSTTVPQNIKGSKIAGRHTPTRNSLRHSRMLVVNNKNYQATQYPNPMNFKCPNLARWILILQTILGLLLSFLAIWIFFLAPNTTMQDNPYWSGLALLLAGIIGLVLVRYQRIKRHKVRENCFVFLRADSYLLSLVALLMCAVALICAAIHFARLTASDTRCVSSNILLEHGSCSCTFNAQALSNNTSYDSNGWLDEATDEFDSSSYTVEYRDLSCQEVTNEWTFILATSIALNSLGFIISLWYIILLACCRQNSKRFYSSVHTSTF